MVVMLGNVIVFLLAAICLVACNGEERAQWQPKHLGSAALKHAGFVRLHYSEDDTLAHEDRWNLFISRFDAGALGQFDYVYYMRAPGRFLDSVSSWSEEHIKEMDHSAFWPNEPTYLPSSVAGSEGVSWSSGFLVPTKTEGKVQLYNTTHEPPKGPYNIASLDSKHWSYHRVLWKDMDADGDLDALTARFHVPTLGATIYDLIWFENKGDGFSEGWTQHVISSNGPDVSFALVTLTADGREYDCILTGEFWEQRISIYWTDSETNDWTDTPKIHSRIINMEAGQVFDIIVGDFNKDGALEFLSTEYDTSIGIGHVTVYHFPADFRTEDFESVVIAEGFRPNQAIGGNTMSPGAPLAFYPSDEYAQEVAEDGMPHKEWFLISGDDDGRMYILYPNSEDRNDWVYQRHILLDTEEQTTGAMDVGDLDGDGYTEIVVAGYSAGKIYVYSYAP